MENRRKSPRRKRRAAKTKSTDALLGDPVVAAYMKDVDRTLLRENLLLTPAQRLEKFVRFARFASALREAGAKARRDKG